MQTLRRWVLPSFTIFFAIVIDSPLTLVNAVASSPKPAAIHLSLSALSVFNTKQPGVAPTLEALTEEAQALLPDGTELPEEFPDAVGEMYVPPSDTIALIFCNTRILQRTGTERRSTKYGCIPRRTSRPGGDQGDHKAVCADRGILLC